MPAALFEAHVPRCPPARLHWSTSQQSSQYDQFVKRRPLKSFPRRCKGQKSPAPARQGCRNGEVFCRCKAVSRAVASATADLRTDQRKKSLGATNGVDVAGNVIVANKDFSLPHIRKTDEERSNGAGPSGHSSARMAGTQKSFGIEASSNGAASSKNLRAADSAADDAVGPASGFEEDSSDASKSAASASSARDRLKKDLDRQRSKAADDPDLRSRKEVLRQLRTGETEGLSEAERLRRTRISMANKGRAPWNAGRKHKPETIEKIRQSTLKAMQDPVVKQKLIAMHEPQMHTEESREKISRGVTMSLLRREGVDLSGLTPEEVDTLVVQRRAAHAAAEAAKADRQAAKRQAAKQQKRTRGQARTNEARFQLSLGFVEGLRNGRPASGAAVTAEKLFATQPSTRKVTQRQPAAGTAPRKAPPRRRALSTAAAKRVEAAAAATAAEEVRAEQLKRALTLVTKLEQALSQCHSHQEAMARSASLEERERVEQVVQNAQEQLLRAKGQVARLQQGAPVSTALSHEETDALSRIMAANGAAGGRPGLARFKRALASDRNGLRRSGGGRNSDNGAAAAEAVLDVEAEDV